MTLGFRMLDTAMRRSCLPVTLVMLGMVLSTGCALRGDDTGSLTDTSVGESADSDDTAGDTAPTSRSEENGTLETTNEIGRTGGYYLPAGEVSDPLPLLVLFHGTGGDGASMASLFESLASELGVAIVAPDSRQSPDGQYTWEVGTEPDEITPDLTHALACVDELIARNDWTLDTDHVMAAGFSGGASSAPYLATNDDLFTAFAVLHGGVYAGGLGDNIVPGWFSTGKDDDARPPEAVQEAYESVEALGFEDLVFTLYAGGHELSDQEKADVLDWWLAL